MLNKKELAAIQDVTGQYENARQMMDEAFDTLKLELEQRGIKPSCSLEGNAEALAATGELGIRRALYLYRKYNTGDTMISQINQLAHNLANATGKNFPLG